MLSPELHATLEQHIAEIEDPDIGLSLGQLGCIHQIELTSATSISVYLEIVPPMYRGLAAQLDSTVREVILKLEPTLSCTVHARPKVIERCVPSPILPQVNDMIAVASGKGGVGKSTLAANLACSLMLEGLSVGLIDADIYGPSVPTLFGLEGHTLHAHRQPDGKIIGYPHVQYGIKVASMGFIMQREQAAIFRGPMLAGYFRTLIEQIEWGELDVIVFDLPPGTGDVQLTLAQQVPLTGAVIVTTPQQLALADVRRSVAMFRRVNVEILGMIENMSYYIPSDAPDKRYSVFGKGGGQQLASEFGVPFFGEIPLDDHIRLGSDNGLPAIINPEAPEYVHEALRAVTLNVLCRMRQVNAQRLAQPRVEIQL